MRSPAHPDYDPLALQWQRPSGLSLHMRTLGDGVAVFNEESGDTHVFDPVVADVLAGLDSSISTASLAKIVASDGDETGACADLAELLRTLYGFGLIEPVPSGQPAVSAGPFEASGQPGPAAT